MADRLFTISCIPTDSRIR